MIEIKIHEDEKYLLKLLPDNLRRSDIEVEIQNIITTDDFTELDLILKISQMCNNANELAFYCFMIGGFLQKRQSIDPIELLESIINK